ncbi:MAG TPA: MBL fold metallo-hydrolase [Holophagaceae bacterium]|nr:MBL fold metallo-hydrolase [Holophagaceae bacterium]
MKWLPQVFLLIGAAFAPLPARADALPASLDMKWDAGAERGVFHPHQAIQVHRYDARTFILREDLCDTFEAPFMYLLVGRDKALLIDTGDISDAKAAPLADTVLSLLRSVGGAKLPLLVVHTHGHLDHRAGDAQFERLPGIQVVPADLDHVRAFFGFTRWPEGAAQVDLGGRIVDVLPAPGHHPAHLVFYDRDTALVLSGDFLMPGRLLVADAGAYEASAKRVAAFLKDRPVSHVLGGHIEKDREGRLFPWQSTYHPGEGPLALQKEDVLALPVALSRFNGFYSDDGAFVILNPIRDLLAGAAALLMLLATAVYVLLRFVRRRRRLRKS